MITINLYLDLYPRDLWSASKRHGCFGNRGYFKNVVMAKQVPDGNSSEDEVSG